MKNSEKPAILADLLEALSAAGWNIGRSGRAKIADYRIKPKANVIRLERATKGSPFANSWRLVESYRYVETAALKSRARGIAKLVAEGRLP